jgi:hypothetical protein
VTPLVETLATTVRPSFGPLEVAEVAAIPAAASEPSAKLVGRLKEGHLFTGRELDLLSVTWPTGDLFKPS